jgi:hypothetical protein
MSGGHRSLVKVKVKVKVKEEANLESGAVM